MMTRPMMGLSLSSPLHAVHVFGLPCASFGSVRAVIFAKILLPSSYTSTVDRILPVFSSTVFQFPTTESAAIAATALMSVAANRQDMVFLICLSSSCSGHMLLVAPRIAAWGRQSLTRVGKVRHSE